MLLKGRSVLITGGGGFVGSNLARACLDHGAEVRVIDDFSSGYERNLTGVDIHLTRESILNTGALAEATSGVDSVVHLAALGSVPRSIDNPQASFEANALGTLNVLEACRSESVPQVLVASSSSVYGSNPSLPRNEQDWTLPLSPYAASKAATETLTLAYGHCYELDVLAFRFFNIYGPRQAPDHPYAAVIPRFLDAALHGRPLEIHGDGLQSRDFTFVDTVTTVLIKALAQRVQARLPVNLAFGTDTSLITLIDTIETLLDIRVERRHTAPRAGDVRASQADGKLIQDLFPDIDPVPLEPGLTETLEWFRTLR